MQWLRDRRKGPGGGRGSGRADRGTTVLALVLLALFGCAAAQATEKKDEAGNIFPLHAEIVSHEELMAIALDPWKGDLDGMIERRMIRVLVVYDDVFYFIDRFRQRGLTYELLTRFGETINKDYKLTHGEDVDLVFIPVGRDRLLADLVAGIGDIAASAITVTPERRKLVAFSDPLDDDVSEVLVAGKDFPKVSTLDELSGKEVAVRPLSSYAASLKHLNRRLKAAGKKEVKVIATDENLTDGAIAGLVAAGVYPATVMDDIEAPLWKKIYPDLVVHDAIALRKGGKIAWAFRKDSPKLEKAINGFVKTHAWGSLFANILIKRYLDNVRFVKHALSDEVNQRLDKTVDIFKTYADLYRFDWLFLVAQAYQESQLDQSVVSSSGAVGLMQLLPSTAAAPPIAIEGIRKAGPNVHAGAKYMRFIIDSYFDDPAIRLRDRHLFALASYNAGPNRIASLRRLAPKMNLDPNRWFGNMEVVVAHHVGRQPVEYVANIFRYYIAYKRSERLRDAERLAEDTGD